MVLSRADAERGSRAEEIPHDHLFKVTGLSSSNLEKLGQESSKESADFETAIAATGYGRFNIALLCCTFPAFFSAVSVTSSVSYIFTRAICDMELSLLDMGTINAITYGGMISSALIWGFLSDTLGRKRIMVYGFFASGFVEMTAAMSQNFAMLLVTRFFAGFLFNGPFAVLVSYMAEMHRTEYRARVILYTTLYFTLTSTLLPILAWGILSNDWELNLFGNTFVIHSWNIFLMLTGIVPLLTGLAFVCLPESPKFLMSRGRNEEAMAVFRRIFAANTGKREDEYPIEKLVMEKSEEQAQGAAALRGGFAQLAPLFRPPHFIWLVLMCCIHVAAMFGSNTLRLWLPQLLAMIGAEEGHGLCSAIAPKVIQPISPDEVELCIPIETNVMTYLQIAIIGSGSLLTVGIGGIIINRCGKKLVAGICISTCAVLVVLLPFVGNGPYVVVAILTIVLAMMTLSSASTSSIIVDLFPTSLRVMAMATFLMFGRLGTITGTIAFPALIEFGCIPPFAAISLILAVSGGGCFLLPNTNLKKLE